MANSGLFDYSRAEDLRLDEIVSNSRPGYLYATSAVNGGTLTTNVLGTNWMTGYGAPTSLTSAVNLTLNAFQLNPSIVTIKNTAAGATINVTFDTAANIVALFNARGAGAVIGDILPVLIINGSTVANNTLTLVAGSGGSFDTNNANSVIAVASSRQVFIRLTNVTGGSEAYIVYF